MNKAQLEIMGLAVIIVLITLGLFFVITFSISEADTTVQSYNQEQRATSFLDALLRTNIPACDDVRFDTILKDCGTTNTLCNGDSCLIVNDTIALITNKTLDVWQLSYNLTVLYPGSRVEFIGRNCTADRDRFRTSEFPIRLYPYPGDVVTSLAVCS